jgi:hypothetical protein
LPRPPDGITGFGACGRTADTPACWSAGATVLNLTLRCPRSAGLDAAGIAEAVDVLVEREVRFGPGGEDAAADAFGFDDHPQVLRQGIVERLTDRAHGRLHLQGDAIEEVVVGFGVRSHESFANSPPSSTPGRSEADALLDGLRPTSRLTRAI